VIIAAKTDDVDLSHSGRENSEKPRREQGGVGSSMIILDRTVKATDNIWLKPGGHRVSQHKIQIALPKMRQLWMPKPRSGKTGFVVWHHDKGYDWKKSRQRDPMALDYGKYRLVNGPPGHIYVFIGQGDLDQIEGWLESGHRLNLR